MTGSSELSDALNPYFYGQQQQTQTTVSPNYDPHTRILAPSSVNVPLQPSIRPFTAHRSELADAINPAAISPNTATRSVSLKQSHQSAADPLQLLKGLIQSIASYKTTVEQEKKRRLVWEQEQETKYIARQAELQERVADLERELNTLKAGHGISHTSSGTPSQSSPQPTDDSAREVSSEAMKGSIMLFEPKDNETNDHEFVEGSSLSPATSTSQKRARSDSPPGSSVQEPMKLRTHRSSRPQSIQAAVRNHILRCMNLDHDKQLPPCHDESVNLPASRPVRFVWDQTTKKSPHNAKMKSRIISDMIDNKELYPLVPSQEFAKAKLESVFEQAYTTLRQKYASQQAPKANSKDRAEMKSQKARRLSRKKLKLANRVATRKDLEHYTLPVFDAAFQIDCMSSEESSEGEAEVTDASELDKPLRGKTLRIRYLAWRSLRLQGLFHIIDEQEQYNRDLKPKRGIGRKDRHMGPPKDGNPPPPKGVSQWMVSKKWLRQATAVNPHIATLVDPYDGNATDLAILGEESGDEQETAGPSQQEYAQMPMPDFSMMQPVPHINGDGYQHAQYMYPQHVAWPDTMASYVDLSQYSTPLSQAYPTGILPSS